MPNPSLREHVEALIRMVEQKQFLEAIQQFYAPDATMQENNQAPRQGLDNLLEYERNVLARFPEVRISRAEWSMVEGGRAVINWIFEFVDAQGRSYWRDEIAYQQWRDGKIVAERFFYDPASAK